MLPPEELMRLDRLTVKEIVNLPRGAPLTDWDLPQTWKVIVKSIEAAIEDRDLQAVPHNSGQVRFAKIKLSELWLWLLSRDESFDPLRSFCTAWAAARGVDLDALRAAPKRGAPRTPGRDEAIADLLDEGDRPGSTTLWKVFEQKVWARCGQSGKLDRGFAPRTIKEATKKIAHDAGIGLKKKQ